jgi:hypothetical protein
VAPPRSGDKSEQHGDKTHEHHWWKDDDDPNIRHSESYDRDNEGNLSNVHYTQNDESEKDGKSQIQ